MIQNFLLIKATFLQMELNFPNFQPIYYTLKTLSNSEKVITWKSKGLSKIKQIRKIE